MVIAKNYTEPVPMTRYWFSLIHYKYH